MGEWQWVTVGAQGGSQQQLESHWVLALLQALLPGVLEVTGVPADCGLLPSCVGVLISLSGAVGKLPVSRGVHS